MRAAVRMGRTVSARPPRLPTPAATRPRRAAARRPARWRTAPARAPPRRLIRCGAGARLAATAQCRRGASPGTGRRARPRPCPAAGRTGPARRLAQRDQPPVERQHLRVRRLVELGPVQLATARRSPGPAGRARRPRASRARRTRAAGPSATAAASSGSGWLVKNCHGVLARPLLAHEQHRRERRGEQQRRADPQQAAATASRRAGRRWRGCRSGRGSAGRPRTGARACGPGRPAGRARRPRKLDQVPAWKNAPVSTVGQALQRAEVGVVALPLAGQQRVQRVVDVVVPLRRAGP